MEAIYTLTVRTQRLVRKHWLLASLIMFAFLLLVLVRIHAESSTFGRYNDDEYHTIYQGLNLIVHGDVENFRAQESVRWLVRAFYPYALVYMNTHIGGNVYIDGWSYPGHNYVVRNFIDKNQTSTTFSNDPSLRVLFHALREQYIVFVFLCLLGLSLFFFKERYKLVAFGTIALLGFSLHLITEQKILYLEPGILASLSLFILAYFYLLMRERISIRSLLLLGFLAAFMVSTKFSTALFVLLPILLCWHLLKPQLVLRGTFIYLGSALASYFLINLPAFLSLKSFNAFLHDLSSNFWQYAAGSDAGITVAPGLMHSGLLAYQLEGFLGYALYTLPVIIVFALWHASSKERMLLVPLLLISIVSIYGLSQQHVYVMRNLVPFYLPIALIALLSIEIVAKRFFEKQGPKIAGGFIGVVTFLWILGIVVNAGGPLSYAATFLPDTRTGFISELHTQTKPEKPEWYTVGFPNGFFKGQDFEGGTKTLAGAPAVLNSKNYPELESRFASLPRNAIVLANNIGNNKHLVTYVLPKYFNKNIQVGSYFAFFNVQ